MIIVEDVPPVHGMVKSSGKWQNAKTKNFFKSALIIHADTAYIDYEYGRSIDTALIVTTTYYKQCPKLISNNPIVK